MNALLLSQRQGQGVCASRLPPRRHETERRNATDNGIGTRSRGDAGDAGGLGAGLLGMLSQANTQRERSDDGAMTERRSALLRVPLIRGRAAFLFFV